MVDNKENDKFDLGVEGLSQIFKKCSLWIGVHFVCQHVCHWKVFTSSSLVASSDASCLDVGDDVAMT